MYVAILLRKGKRERLAKKYDGLREAKKAYPGYLCKMVGRIIYIIFVE